MALKGEEYWMAMDILELRTDQRAHDAVRRAEAQGIDAIRALPAAVKERVYDVEFAVVQELMEDAE